eukprot:CAMPEP_0173240744 /NCGR_PEP_ID=MMETSP1142-20121109/13961_1 /TAXON_ID=483371 /ORGANISM="non described non described, Strain CCMP2298" /LENGTH=101 /DNA_ID=CAMNT_0014171949 /DNA_START=66 /DNA_END=371 /DNA_ORIENTATION=-
MGPVPPNRGLWNKLKPPEMRFSGPPSSVEKTGVLITVASLRVGSYLPTKPAATTRPLFLPLPLFFELPRACSSLLWKAISSLASAKEPKDLLWPSTCVMSW